MLRYWEDAVDPDEETPRTEWWISRSMEDFLRAYPDILDIVDDPDLQGQIASKILASPGCERLLSTGELTTRDKLWLASEFFGPLGCWTHIRTSEAAEPAFVQAEVCVQRDALVQTLTFLKRRGPMAEGVKLSSAGKALLIDGGGWKAEVPAVGVWPVVVTLRTDRLYEVLRLKRLLPETVAVAVADPYLRVHDWSLEVETVTPSDPSA